MKPFPHGEVLRLHLAPCSEHQNCSTEGHGSI
ncbi:hypothetical protein MUK42_36344 [Musa troglodytarum]|uniref:Uncharacterized protein n=1 Tax=Musa troglodytarum TaxID=320322 RepID=A0A9E7G778_9LILI|nr:hypothetical protein MUK42_36344 [Musa troglodytarum]